MATAVDRFGELDRWTRVRFVFVGNLVGFVLASSSTSSFFSTTDDVDGGGVGGGGGGGDDGGGRGGVCVGTDTDVTTFSPTVGNGACDGGVGRGGGISIDDCVDFVATLILSTTTTTLLFEILDNFVFSFEL